jgi:hypothetical protein
MTRLPRLARQFSATYSITPSERARQQANGSHDLHHSRTERTSVHGVQVVRKQLSPLFALAGRRFLPRTCRRSVRSYSPATNLFRCGAGARYSRYRNGGACLQSVANSPAAA